MPNLRFISASPYQDDVLSLPVHDLSASILFYEKFMKFQVIRRETKPYQLAILSRDEVKIGLAENGGDPEQEGVYFTVNSVKQAFDFFLQTDLKTLTIRLYPHRLMKTVCFLLLHLIVFVTVLVKISFNLTKVD